MPAIAKAQTIKQAKASFKARGRPSLTEKESRQLERALVLEARAEKARETEKRRAEAAKKRAEKAGKPAVQLGSQRRVDRFGHLASQFHLGAFFGKPKEKEVQTEPEEEDFEDDGLDDEELLKALAEGPANAAAEPEQKQRGGIDSVQMPPHPVPRTSLPAPARPSFLAPESFRVAHAEELDSFWEALGSSTQIARELDNTGDWDDPRGRGVRIGSFNSTDLSDLTAEDLDMLDPPKQGPVPAINSALDPSAPRPAPVTNIRQQKPSVRTGSAQGSMLPPPRPFKATGAAQKSMFQQNPNAGRPRLPSIRPAQPSIHTRPASRAPMKAVQPTKPQNVIKGPFMSASSLYCSPNLGFTLTQLETFVDDDLQLTQAPVG